MKNASLVLNVVLLIAVAVLFYLHFSSAKKTEPVKVASSNNAGTTTPGVSKIAYFEMDSLNNSFALVKEVKAELGREEEKMNSELTRLQKTYNDKFTQYQSQAQTMSSVESEKAKLSPNSLVSVTAAAPEITLWPLVCSGKGGVCSRGTQFSSMY